MWFQVFKEHITLVQVTAPDRGSIEAVFEVFERHAASSRLPVPKKKPLDPPTIFIGHGAVAQWRDLKDHLHEKHAYAWKHTRSGPVQVMPSATYRMTCFEELLCHPCNDRRGPDV